MDKKEQVKKTVTKKSNTKSIKTAANEEKLGLKELAAALALPVIKVRTLYRILNISYDTKLTPSEAKEKFMGVI